MPLDHSGTKTGFKRNVETLMGEIGQSPHVQSRSQALAIAYSLKRRARDGGGPVQLPVIPLDTAGASASNPVEQAVKILAAPRTGNVQSIKTRNIIRAMGGSVVHVGPIRSTVPGRTDKHDMDVPSGSYVLPAECVSNLGQNNTEAGLAKLQEMMRGSPESIRRFFGSTRPPVHRLLRSHNPVAPVPIRAAGGEFVMTPEQVGVVGYGSVEHGHDVLDKWVLKRRKEHIKTLRGLAPPARD